MKGWIAAIFLGFIAVAAIALIAVIIWFVVQSAPWEVWLKLLGFALFLRLALWSQEYLSEHGPPWKK